MSHFGFVVLLHYLMHVCTLWEVDVLIPGSLSPSLDQHSVLDGLPALSCSSVPSRQLAHLPQSR